MTTSSRVRILLCAILAALTLTAAAAANTRYMGCAPGKKGVVVWEVTPGLYTSSAVIVPYGGTVQSIPAIIFCSPWPVGNCSVTVTTTPAAGHFVESMSLTASVGKVVGVRGVWCTY